MLGRGSFPLPEEQRLIFGYVLWTWFESDFYRIISRFSVGFLIILMFLGFHSMIASVHIVWLRILHANDMDNDTLSYIQHSEVCVHNCTYVNKVQYINEIRG